MEFLGLRGLRTGGAGLSQGVGWSSLGLQGDGGRAGAGCTDYCLADQAFLEPKPTHLSYILVIYLAAVCYSCYEIKSDTSYVSVRRYQGLM